MSADPALVEQLRARLAQINERIAGAAAAVGRSAAEVTVVAAAKRQSAAVVRAALAAGVAELGHNYVQEAAAMQTEVDAPAVWRLIGPLQRNKVGLACRTFDTFDSVGEVTLAQALARRWVELHRGRRCPVLMQIRIGDEASKSGVAPAAAAQLLADLQLLPALECQGLMAMPPPRSGDEARADFAELRGLAERLRSASGLSLPVLSMGMSGDFEAAVKEGATQVRLGTVLFGPRLAREVR